MEIVWINNKWAQFPSSVSRIVRDLLYKTLVEFYNLRLFVPPRSNVQLNFMIQNCVWPCVDLDLDIGNPLKYRCPPFCHLLILIISTCFQNWVLLTYAPVFLSKELTQSFCERNRKAYYNVANKVFFEGAPPVNGKSKMRRKLLNL